jgi:HAD superfamily hydrolase (TIGR01490 family)
MTSTTRSDSSPALALFDLDNTLLPLDSDSAWTTYLIDRGVFDRAKFEAQNARFYEQYKAGTLDIFEYVAFVFAPLRTTPIPLLEEWRADYFATRIAPHIHSQALALVKKHQDAGDLCAIVTATNSFVTAPIAKAFGVSTLIGTDLEIINNSFTGKPQGIPAFREGKITRTEQWLAAQGKRMSDFPRTWFYSDSINDLPMLKFVSNPVAANPDERLLTHARNAGWPVLMLFGDAA